MNKKKVLKTIGIILLIIVVLILVHTIRNTIIISNLQNKVKKYSNSNNYHIKAVTYVDENTTMTINQYQKEEKQLLILERTVNDETVKISVYNNGNRIDMFTETKEEKIATLGKINSIIGIQTIEFLQTDNLWQTILYGLPAIIRTTNVDEHKCYNINNFLSPYYLAGKNKTEYYMDKETGLMMKSIIDETISTREYEFDNVSDEIFIEPDISQYTLKSEE